MQHFSTLGNAAYKFFKTFRASPAWAKCVSCDRGVGYFLCFFYVFSVRILHKSRNVVLFSPKQVYASSRHFDFFFKRSACIKSHLPHVENRV